MFKDWRLPETDTENKKRFRKGGKPVKPWLIGCVRDEAAGLCRKKERAPVENKPTRRLSQMKDTPHLLSKNMKRNPHMKTERPVPTRPHPPVFVFDPAAIRDLVSGIRLASV